MRDPEQKLWDDIRDAMVGRWHAQRHEDRYAQGVPDVSFGLGRTTEGWIELKCLGSWPGFHRPGPWNFANHHLTPEQRNWMDQRIKHGLGRVFLVCRFGDEATLIWRWAALAPLLGVGTIQEIAAAASAQWWHGPIDGEDLFKVIKNCVKIPVRVSAQP
ncbi:MAG: hypothetical protein DDT26_00014 [Dehalococcoidia bacterium]|nr:hypothetical protein [Chloroflexota bacterium]